MRFKEYSATTISKDNVAVPSLIRFSEQYDEVDYESLKNVMVDQKVFPFGRNEISRAAGSYIYVRASEACNLIIDNAVLPLIKNKVTKLWCTFSVVLLDITAQEGTDVLIIVAG